MNDDKQKHTPGPWAVRHESPLSQQEAIDTVAILNMRRVQYSGVEQGGRVVALVPWSDYPELKNDRANARLIAAAPEMLEALQNIENDGKQVPAHAWDLIQSAIAKATGDTP